MRPCLRQVLMRCHGMTLWVIYLFSFFRYLILYIFMLVCTRSVASFMLFDFHLHYIQCKFISPIFFKNKCTSLTYWYLILFISLLCFCAHQACLHIPVLLWSLIVIYRRITEWEEVLYGQLLLKLQNTARRCANPSWML